MRFATVDKINLSCEATEADGVTIVTVKASRGGLESTITERIITDDDITTIAMSVERVVDAANILYDQIGDDRRRFSSIYDLIADSVSDLTDYAVGATSVVMSSAINLLAIHRLSYSTD